MQVGIDSFAAALDENSRAVNPVRAGIDEAEAGS
jgi:hypothetical protein